MSVSGSRPPCRADGRAMPDAFDATDYSVVVKLRAPLPAPWRWEIYRAGKSSPVERSADFFQSVAAAHVEGKAALSRLLNRLANLAPPPSSVGAPREMLASAPPVELG